MRSQPLTKTEIGKLIRDTIRAGKAYQERPTPENKSRYDHLFEEVHEHFQPKVKGRSQAKIQPFNGRREDAEEITQDIFLEIYGKLPQFK